MRKFIKRTLLVVLILLVVVQIPFIYRRYKTGQLAEKIVQIQSTRQETNNTGYTDYKGVVHVHTGIGGHSTGRFDELLDGAKANALDFVVMTEHVSPATIRPA